MGTDKRNCNVTHKVFEVLNNVKGFDVAMGDSSTGKLIIRHEGTSFYMTIEPMFNDNDAGKEADDKPFEEIARTHQWALRK